MINISILATMLAILPMTDPTGGPNSTPPIKELVGLNQTQIDQLTDPVFPFSFENKSGCPTCNFSAKVEIRNGDNDQNQWLLEQFDLPLDSYVSPLGYMLSITEKPDGIDNALCVRQQETDPCVAPIMDTCSGQYTIRIYLPSGTVFGPLFQGGLVQGNDDWEDIDFTSENIFCGETKSMLYAFTDFRHPVLLEQDTIEIIYTCSACPGDIQ